MLGTGRMGAAMARRLGAAGHRLTLWNRTRQTADLVAAGIQAPSSAGLATPDTAAIHSAPPVRVVERAVDAVAGAEFVLTMLADGEATVHTVLDPAVLAALPAGAIVCDLGTSGTDAALRMDAGLRATGRSFVDAPVSGSVPSVAAGQLLVLASGDTDTVDAVRPILESFARKVIHVGPAGAGQAMKLAVNLVVHTLNVALSEALVLAERAGITPERAYDVIEDSVVGAPYVRYKRAAFLDPEHPVAMSLDLVGKDQRLIVAFAEELGLPVPATTAAAEVVAAACAEGWGSQDMAALRRFLRESAPPRD